MGEGDQRGIFISYRRDDAAGWPRTIRTELAHKLPGVEIFRDVDALEAGDVWEQEINDTLTRSDVVLVLIGKRFATGNNRKRLNDPNDTLAREITMSIAAGITIIPVLVDGAKFPRLAALPEPLRVLADFQHQEVHDVGFEGAMESLASTLRRKLNLAADRRAERDKRAREKMARDRQEREAAAAARVRLEQVVAEKPPEVEPPPGDALAPPPPRTPHEPLTDGAGHRAPPPVPFPLLEVLAFGYSTKGTDRHELGAGRPVLDLAGRTAALVTSRARGTGQSGGLMVFDPNGQAALALPSTRPRERRRSLTGPARNAIGQFRWSAGSPRMASTVSFWTATGPEGYAHVQGLGRRGVVVFSHALLHDSAGKQIGRLLNHTRSHPLADLGSWEKTLPEGSWLLLERSPDVDEPLRSFVAAFPLLLTSLWRMLNGRTLAGLTPPAPRAII